MHVVAGVMMGLVMAMSMIQETSQRVLCGRTLADALDLVCAGRGFYFNKRSADEVPNAPASAKTDGARSRRSGGAGHGGPARSVVDECCRRSCSFSTLESYCAPAPVVEDDYSASDPLNDLERFFWPRHSTPTGTTMFPTTQTTTHFAPHTPSAEVYRGPSRGVFPQNARKFFYVPVGGRPTRNPLIEEE